jgi:hypothetical protein
LAPPGGADLARIRGILAGSVAGEALRADLRAWAGAPRPVGHPISGVLPGGREPRSLSLRRQLSPFRLRIGMVDELVDHRRGDDLVAEDLAPAREGLVRGDDHRRPLVAEEASENIRLAASG